MQVSRRIVGRIVNMRIEQQALSLRAAMSGAVLVKGGATLVIEECSLTSASGHCIVVQGLHSYGCAQWPRLPIPYAPGSMAGWEARVCVGGADAGLARLDGWLGGEGVCGWR